MVCAQEREVDIPGDRTGSEPAVGAAFLFSMSLFDVALGQEAQGICTFAYCKL